MESQLNMKNDFLVNIFEEGMKTTATQAVKE
jgi:hypothetical protein